MKLFEEIIKMILLFIVGFLISNLWKGSLETQFVLVIITIFCIVIIGIATNKEKK